jgi:hypothetical protein
MAALADLDDLAARAGITVLRGAGLRLGELLDRVRWGPTDAHGGQRGVRNFSLAIQATGSARWGLRRRCGSTFW